MGRAKIKHGIIGLIILLIINITFTGCSETEKSNSSESSENVENVTEGKDSAEVSEPIKITYWAATSPETRADDPEYLECFKEVEEKFNIDIEWIHIPKGTEHEQFQLMVVSDSLADVIFYSWVSSYGPEKAIADEIIIPLNDIIDKYAPNLKRILEEYPDEIARDMRTDDGYYYCFPYLRGVDMWDRVINGLYLRKDWLDDLGLKPPETIDEWHTVLKAFKEQKGAEIPLGLKMGNIIYFSLAWGLKATDLVPDGKKIIMGAIQPEYKEFLETIRKWIAEGLLVIDPPDLANSIIGGKCGAWVSTPGQYVKEGREIDPKFDIIPVPNPVAKKGQTPYFLPRWPYTGRGAAISTDCDESKYEAIAKWLDYAYSEEGYIRDNFGIEGVDFTWVDGKIMPTDIKYNPPNGWTTSEYLRRHFRPQNAPGPYFTGNQQRYLHPKANERDPMYKYKKEAIAAWSTGSPERTLPTLSFTPEEREELDSCGEQMWNYISKMLRDFMFGRASLDQFDNYVEEAKRLGALKWVEIYQKAYDRYWNR